MGHRHCLREWRSIYPAAVDNYLDALVASTGYWKLSGNADDQRYLIDFEQLGAWQRAGAMLQDAGCNDLRRNRTALTLEPPRRLGGARGQDTRKLLGLPDEAERP